MRRIQAQVPAKGRAQQKLPLRPQNTAIRQRTFPARFPHPQRSHLNRGLWAGKSATHHTLRLHRTAPTKRGQIRAIHLPA